MRPLCGLILLLLAVLVVDLQGQAKPSDRTAANPVLSAARPLPHELATEPRATDPHR